MTTFLFVRHGLTAHTGKRLTGWAEDVALTDEGAAQAEALARRLSELPVDAVYSSPIQRTLETARPIAAAHGLQVQTNKDLGEVHYGEWTNRSFKSLARTKLWGVLQRWPSGARFPDGENLLEVQARALSAVERLTDRHRGQLVCCVSHADVIKLLFAHYIGAHIDLFQRLVISPASISSVRIGDGGPLVLAVNTSVVSVPVKP